MQKKQVSCFRDQFEKCCSTVPMFQFKAKYDINLMENFLQPNLVNERDNVPIARENFYQFSSFNFGNVRMLELLTSLGAVTNLVSFPKA